MQNFIFRIFGLFVCILFLVACKNGTNTLLINDQKGILTENPERINTICFGSCNKQWKNQNYWAQISSKNPDLWIWTGDIVYSDTEDMLQMKEHYDIQKAYPQYRDFSDSVKIIGIWDDHDYGVNDGGKEYPKKEECREILFDFLDIDEKSIERNHAGAYQSYTFGSQDKKVKVILLDGRYFRDELEKNTKSKHRYIPNGRGSFLGKQQWVWLEKELTNSKAQLNLIISGVQVIPQEHYFEKWANFPKERKRLFDLIINSGAKNPFFISGDRHIAEMMKMTYEEQIFYEITSSGLTHSYKAAEEQNVFRISPLIKEKNFGELALDWQKDSLKVNCIIHQIDGEELFSKEILFPL